MHRPTLVPNEEQSKPSMKSMSPIRHESDHSRRAPLLRRSLLLLGGGVLALSSVGTMFAMRTGGQVTIPTTSADFFEKGTQPQPDPELFDQILTSQNCTFCHSDYGIDVAPYDSWVTSMMGQSANDPVFLAALTIANQDANLAGMLCLRCHAPGAFIGGRTASGTTADFTTEDFDGINCNFCHRVVNPVLGAGSAIAYPTGPANPDNAIIASLVSQNLLPSGAGNARYVLDPQDNRRGPFSDVPQNLHGFSSSNNQVELITSPFHEKSEFCGTCHDVSNPAFSKNAKGQFVLNALGKPHPTDNPADMMPEQRTFSEWSISDFVNGVGYADHRFGGNDPDGVVSSCQDCHMPKVIAGGCVFYQYGEPWFERPDMPQHSFAGSNSWVIRALREQYGPEEADARGLTQERVDAASARNETMIANGSDMTLSQAGENLIVRVTNQTGHKLPTGYPEGRRVWVHVRFLNEKGVVVGEHGAYDALTATLDAESTKVYECRFGMSSAVAKAAKLPAGESFHLVLNNILLKDNRIPPRGVTNAELASIGAPVVGASYADGQYWDDSLFAIPDGATSAVVETYLQTSSREYMEFLRDANVTDTRGQVVHDLYTATGESAPVIMDAATISLVPTLLGDLNGDGAVNAQDIALLLNNWLGSGTGDLNNDGVVDASDLTIMLNAWTG